MRTLRLASVAASMAAAGAALLLLGAVPVLAEDPPPDTTPPTGTLSVNGGAAATNSLELHLDVPATDDVGVAAVQVIFDGGPLGDQVAYAPALTTPMPGGTSDGMHRVAVVWYDAAGNSGWSDTVELRLDRQVPIIGQPQWPVDTDGLDASVPLIVPSLDGWPIESLRFSVNGTTWGVPVPYADVVDYPFLDPVLGGSTRLGPRQVYVRAVDAAGNVSATVSGAWEATVRAPIKVSPDAPSTGHRITLTPQYAAPVTWPSGTNCAWDVMWGDNQSLYYGNRNDTFGYFYTYGPASKGYCDPRSFTLPWMPYPRVMVSFRAEVANSENAMVSESIGGSPEEKAIAPLIDSTSRRIGYSNVPMVYILPEDYILAVGQRTTYRAYSVNGAPIGSRDLWSVGYIDTPEQHYGGTSLTFTPKRTGYITVCWGSDTMKSTRYSACYDPPVKRRDSTRPRTSAPVQRINAGTVAGTRVPVTLTWTGSDVGWGIRTYQLERSLDGGAWRRILTARVRTSAQSVVLGHRYRYRVRAVDKAGNVGAWDYGHTFRPSVAEDGAASVVYSGVWATAGDATARGGVLHESVTAASAATFTFTGRDVAWLSERGPVNGRAAVYVDGKLVATVDLHATADTAAAIVYRRHWGARATHVIRIVPAVTVDRPVVGVDGFAVLR